MLLKYISVYITHLQLIYTFIIVNKRYNDKHILQSLLQSIQHNLLLLICCMLIPLNFRFIQLYISIRNSSTYFLISSNSALTSGTSDLKSSSIHNLVPWPVYNFLYTQVQKAVIYALLYGQLHSFLHF